MPKLAINGGKPIRSKPFPRPNSIGEEEKKAVLEVLNSGILSKFLGSWTPDFYGGPRVKQFEKEWAEYFGVKNAISVNSATSGLYASVGAAGINPGDEIIVSPYTMSASATAALIYGAIPVFADIDPEIYCLTPKSIKEKITKYTKAIIVVDLFGHPAELDEIMTIAKNNDLIVIEDNAQGPGTFYKNRYAGSLADIGVFSLNYHKTIQTGEGGVIVTNDDEFAERLRLIRNHAEVVVGDKGTKNIINMVGFNFRMTEIEAAIGSEQLKKLKQFVYDRQNKAEYLSNSLKGLLGINIPITRQYATHGFYQYCIRYDSLKTGVPRDKFLNALKAEGLTINPGYVKPLYLEPLYQQKIAFGSKGFPFSFEGYKGNVSYSKGICPITEKMHFEELMNADMCHSAMTKQDLDDIIKIFEKVCYSLSELR